VIPASLGAAASALALALAVSGCVVLGRTHIGEVPSAGAVMSVSEGADIGEVLARLGAPLESWMAPDGLLLIWREWRYNYERLEIDPSRPLAFVTIDPVIGTAVNNLKLILERGTLRENRLAVLFDRGGRVVAVAQRDGDGQRLR
jgi:hypothetical protein